MFKKESTIKAKFDDNLACLFASSPYHQRPWDFLRQMPQAATNYFGTGWVQGGVIYEKYWTEKP
jgi:hypothetical protein